MSTAFESLWIGLDPGDADVAFIGSCPREDFGIVAPAPTLPIREPVSVVALVQRQVVGKIGREGRSRASVGY